jgi:hypothetical protein
MQHHINAIRKADDILEARQYLMEQLRGILDPFERNALASLLAFTRLKPDVSILKTEVENILHSQFCDVWAIAEKYDKKTAL